MFSCTSETKTTEKSNLIDSENNTEISSEIDNEIIDSMPDSLTETVGAIAINEVNEEKPEIEENEGETEKPESKIKKEVELTKTQEVKSNPPIIEKPVEEAPKVKAEIHKTWDDLTRKHISSSGKVNYAGFKKDKEELVKYIKELQSYHKDVSSWSKNKRLAYWINVYNAVTVKLIVDNYPLKSITDLHGGKPWDKKLINLGGTDYTLNVIEKKIIIAKFKEPRIHFAVNCAAKSCPKILNRAWTEDNIQRYLTKQTKAFLANSSQNTITEDKVVISKIFDWYKADFGTSNENVIKFINKYSDTEVKSSATVTYNEYDWSLNN